MLRLHALYAREISHRSNETAEAIGQDGRRLDRAAPKTRGGESGRPQHEGQNAKRPQSESSHDVPRRSAAPFDQTSSKELTMQDLIFAICSVGFFLVAIAYVWACDRLK